MTTIADDRSNPCKAGVPSRGRTLLRSPRIIDLTLTLREGMRGVEFEVAKTLQSDGWNARTLHLYSHAGTHMDAQTHFGAGSGTIDDLPLEICMGPAWVVHVAGLAPRG